MTLKVISSLLLGIFVVSSHAAAFVEGGVASSDPATRFEPQVALVCKSRNQYHAQYMSESGKWVTDTASKVTCLKEKVDILEYCKQVYPNREITNIVESSRYLKVPNFCKIGHTKCRSSVFVKPYRCLEGSFQSDALLVPEGCLFDHIHNQSRCWEFDQWNTTADQACQVKNLSLKAFAMLLPCGIDVFSGVEFVCCPKDFKNHGKAQTMEVEEPIALPQTDRRAESSNHGSPRSESTTPSQEVGTRDEYFSRFDPHEEHDAFRKAEQRLEERHREKVSKIMKEWSELEEHYKTLHMEDPAGAEDFKRRMTMRFQETVQSVEAENEAEKHQLTALHQQRIVAHINEMKREAMTCYTRALSATQTNLPLQTHKVQKCLQKLLRALNKDRHHTVSHFKHLLNSDYEAADRERDSTLQHLADLDRMVNQSLNMLARKPELYAKIGRLMHEYAATLRSKDITPPELTPAPPRDKDEFLGDEDDADDEMENDDDDDDDYDDDDDEEEDAGDDDDDSDEDDDSEDETVQDSHSPTATEGAESIPAEDASASSSPNIASPSSPTNKDIPLSPSEDLPSAASVHQMDVPNVAHAQHHVFSHSQPQSYSVTREQTNPESRGVYFTLAFAGIALMGAMIVGIVVLRRRNNRHPHNQGFMEVDQAVTPEERHVTNMQVNGYENPTYKYFEEK
ncbi:UNVERIFIED_CONTAM: hypothetical protein RMT77_006496 [Armadillidium vulgare]